MSDPFLFIPANQFGIATGADPIGLPSQLQVLDLGSNFAASQTPQQVQAIVSTAVNAGGVVDLADGERLSITSSVVTPLGVTEQTLQGVVVGGEPAITVDPQAAEAQFVAGLQELINGGALIPVLNPDGSISLVPPPSFVETNTAPPPVPAQNDPGTIQPGPPPAAEEQALGSNTWFETIDLGDGTLQTNVYHETGPGTSEIISIEVVHVG